MSDTTTMQPPADTLVSDLSLSDSEDEEEGEEVEVGGGRGGGGGEGLYGNGDEADDLSNDAGNAKAGKGGFKDELDSDRNVEGKTEVKSKKNSEERGFNSDRQKCLKRRREEESEEKVRIQMERKRFRNIFEKSEEIKLRACDEDWALLSLESEEDDSEDEDNLDEEKYEEGEEEEDKWKSTIDKLKTIVEVRRHKKRMFKKKKEEEHTNDKMLDLNDMLVPDKMDDHDEIHFEKDFDRSEFKKTKFDNLEMKSARKTGQKITRRRAGG